MCPACHLPTDTVLCQVPLIPMLIVQRPFDRMALDVAGPFLKSTMGYQFVLVILHYATRYPDVISLGSVTGRRIVEGLVKWISEVGILQELLTDQDTTVMSGVLKGVCEMLKIKQL